MSLFGSGSYEGCMINFSMRRRAPSPSTYSSERRMSLILMLSDKRPVYCNFYYREFSESRRQCQRGRKLNIGD
jgi:hypothetical protein